MTISLTDLKFQYDTNREEKKSFKFLSVDRNGPQRLEMLYIQAEPPKLLCFGLNFIISTGSSKLKVKKWVLKTVLQTGYENKISQQSS